MAGHQALHDTTGQPTPIVVLCANVIDENKLIMPEIDRIPSDCTHCIAWSGTLDDDLFGRDNPMTWLGPGRSALDGFIASITPTLRDRGIRLLLRPHCRHVLGDATTARSFIESLDPGLPIGIALDATAILETDMLRAAPDHYRRTFEILGPIAELVILTGAKADESAEDQSAENVRQIPLAEDTTAASLLIDLYHEHCKPQTPVALLGDGFETDLQMLREASTIS